MRKMMLVCLLTILFLSACSGPPVGLEECTDANQYLRVNTYVMAHLQHSHESLFPSNVNSAADYYYRYECALLGEPSFMVYLKQDFPSREELTEESDKLAAMLPKKIVVDGCITAYASNDIYSAVALLTDDEINDGMALRLEMVIIDSASLTIEYLSALQQDNAARHELLMNFVNRI